MHQLTLNGDPDGVAGVRVLLPPNSVPRVRRPARQVGPVVPRAGLQHDDADRHVVGGGGVFVEDGRAREIELEERVGVMDCSLQVWLQLVVWSIMRLAMGVRFDSFLKRDIFLISGVDA